MKIEDYNAIMTDIAQSLSDQPKVTTLLSKLRDDYNEMTASLDNKTKEADKHKKDYEDALKYNMQMFLERGVKPQEQTKPESHTDEKKLNCSDLDLSNF